MEKRRVEVTINGQVHAFVASDGGEYIRGLADYLNEKIAEISGASYGSLLPNDKKYVLAAMNILDDYYKILTKYEQLSKKSGENDAITNTTDSSAKSRNSEEIEEYVRHIRALQKENAQLKDKLKNAEYELEYVQNLYEELKKEYEQA